MKSTDGHKTVAVMHLHKWTKWETSTASFLTQRGTTFKGTIQYRTCVKCGKVQVAGV